LLGNKSFQPNPVKVKVGDTITWLNQDWQSHRLMSPPETFDSSVPAGANFDSGWLAPGQSFSITMTRPAGFHYQSVLESDMIGTIIVTAAAGGNQSTSEVRMHIEEACMALQNNDTQGAMMQLNLALIELGGGTQGNMTSTPGEITGCTTTGGGGTTSGGGIGTDDPTSESDNPFSNLT
jgi:hypothetical protein